MNKLTFVKNHAIKTGNFNIDTTVVKNITENHFNNISTKTGVLHFHQGWTDIVNCFSLINIYASKYDTLYLIMREDAKPLISFYTRNIPNIVLIFITHDDLLKYGFIYRLKNIDINGYEFIGGHDSLRPQADPYNNAYERLVQSSRRTSFERAFYEAYNIPYSDKIRKFEIQRDLELENETYTRIVKNQEYVCVHDRNGVYPINPKNDYDIIELAEATDVFFDYIKILQNAKEIHLIDSVWAAICYQLDAKYRLFENVPIYVYCFRDFYRMFTEPVRLSNWNIILKLTWWDSA